MFGTYRHRFVSLPVCKALLNGRFVPWLWSLQYVSSGDTTVLCIAIEMVIRENCICDTFQTDSLCRNYCFGQLGCLLRALFNGDEDMHKSWWRHQMETFPAWLVICAGNSPVPGEIPAHRPVTQSFDVFFDLRLNKRLSKQSWGWWFETLSRLSWRHYNGSHIFCFIWDVITLV